MADKYKIPLHFKKGKFNLKDLSQNDDNSIVLSLGQYDILSYLVPEYETEVRIYSVNEQDVKETLSAVYDDNGQLENIKFCHNGKTKLVYIHFNDDEDAKEKIWNFSKFNADKISDEIIKCKEKTARLFIEYFYDGVAVDFAAKVGTVADKQAVIDSLSEKAKQRGLDKTVIDNCGDYPHKNRIVCDTDTFGIMLLCANPDINSELFGFAVSVMTNHIKERVLDIIDKSDDFKFIVQEYD